MTQRAKQQNPGFSETLSRSGKSLITALTAQIALLVCMVMVFYGIRKGVVQDQDLWVSWIISCLPWGVIALQYIAATSTGISGIFSPPTAPIGTKEAIITNGITFDRGPDVRMVPVYRDPVAKYEDVYMVDLVYFIRRTCLMRDWSQRAWVQHNPNKRMPSGITITKEYHKKLIEKLTRAKIIVGYKQGSKGTLRTFNAAEIMNHLEIPEQYRQLMAGELVTI